MEHIESLEKLFSRLRKANVKLSPKKCHFMMKEVDYLGHKLSGQGIHTSPKKVQIITNYPSPPTCKVPKKALLSFLGMISYYKKFIPNYSGITACLYDLTVPARSFEWSETHEQAFNECKRLLTSAPILATPDWTKPFVIHCDASKFALGCVLLQKYDSGLKVLAYGGRKLTPTEAKYSAYEREFLAVIYSLKHFSQITAGSQVEVVTDNKALSQLLTQKPNPNDRIMRWKLMLSMYNMTTLKHRKGADHQDADALSRFDYDEIKVGDPHYFGQTEDKDMILNTNVDQTFCSSPTSSLPKPNQCDPKSDFLSLKRPPLR